MLIKQADNKADAIAELERLIANASPSTRKSLETELRNLRAGIKGENESAYLIDFNFAESKNWMVLHDLRIEHGNQVAQIDHLLINRWMECYVLETKHFHAGLKINEQGEFERWNDYRKTFEGMPSPLQQNQRHIQVLEKLSETLDMPTRLGMRIPLSFHTLILVSTSARITRPKHFDSSRVIKADQLKERLWKDVDGDNAVMTILKSAAKLVGSDTIEHIAKKLAARHRPIKSDYRAKFGITPEQSAPDKQPSTIIEATAKKSNPVSGPICKQCQSNAGEVLYGKYGYYFRCASCNANTAIKFTCETGHQPRLRKEGLKFYRECEQCKSSELVFTNAKE